MKNLFVNHKMYKLPNLPLSRHLISLKHQRAHLQKLNYTYRNS